MKTDRYLERLKKEYLKTQPSKRMVDFGWDDLEILLIEEEMRKSRFPRFLTYATLVLIIVLGAFFGFFQAANASLPGQPLYPVKRLSETIIRTASPTSDIKVENRAKEILQISKSKKGKESLPKTVEDYQKAVSQIKEELSSLENREEFQKKLEEQEEQFREAQKHGSSKELERAIEAAKEGRSGPDGGDDDNDRSGSDSGPH